MSHVLNCEEKVYIHKFETVGLDDGQCIYY